MLAGQPSPHNIPNSCLEGASSPCAHICIPMTISQFECYCYPGYVSDGYYGCKIINIGVF